jgi:hypothetical protein
MKEKETDIETGYATDLPHMEVRVGHAALNTEEKLSWVQRLGSLWKFLRKRTFNFSLGLPSCVFCYETNCYVFF